MFYILLQLHLTTGEQKYEIFPHMNKIVLIVTIYEVD
jgi:hypothetical protein